MRCSPDRYNLKTNLMGRLRKGQGLVGRRPQEARVPFERRRGFQVADPLMGYVNRLLTPWTLDGGYVNMRSHGDIVTNGRLTVCEVDLEGRVKSLIPYLHDTHGSLFTVGKSLDPDTTTPRKFPIRSPTFSWDPPIDMSPYW